MTRSRNRKTAEMMNIVFVFGKRSVLVTCMQDLNIWLDQLDLAGEIRSIHHCMIHHDNASKPSGSQLTPQNDPKASNPFITPQRLDRHTLLSSHRSPFAREKASTHLFMERLQIFRQSQLLDVQNLPSAFPLVHWLEQAPWIKNLCIQSPESRRFRLVLADQCRGCHDHGHDQGVQHDQY